MLVTTHSAINTGLDLQTITVEAVASRGVPRFIIVGMPTKVVVEARERTSTALRNLGIRPLRQRVVVNLAPAHLPKQTTHHDLAILVSLLQLAKVLPIQPPTTLWLGELGLDGSLKPVFGLFNLVCMAKSAGFKEVVFPASQLHEIDGSIEITMRPLHTVAELLTEKRESLPKLPQRPSSMVTTPSWRSIAGQAAGKRSLLIALAGRHNTYIVGPPGAGKTELAQAATSFLPALTPIEAQLVQRLNSLRQHRETLQPIQPPVRLVNSTITKQNLLGTHKFPGELPMAHHGVIILDEMMEYSPSVIESLREPMQTGLVRYHHLGQDVRYPAQCLVLATANPCACGYAGTTVKTCVCLPQQRQRYQTKISGAIKDRFAIWLRLSSESSSNLLSQVYLQSEAEINMAAAAKVKKTRDYLTQIKQDVPTLQRKLNNKSRQIITTAVDRFSLSSRRTFSLLRVAFTIAVWEGVESISENHMLEALQYRPEIQ